jgi:PTH2 family peptidyl-tRNA hydrolase
MKQVIVLRKDLNMRKGKMVAQGAHASLAAFLLASAKAKKAWAENFETKICVSVDSEKELLDIYAQAKSHDLTVALIEDKAFTEFNEPTLTALAIGPAESEIIDKVTKSLKLL